MKITTRQTSAFIDIKVDVTEDTVYKNGNESNELIENLLETVEELCKLRDENIYEYLEKHYNIKIKQE